jgi:hypothetical protein
MSLFSAGHVIPLAPVDVTALAAWIVSIPFAAWPQQTRAKAGRPAELKPAMVNDPAWHGLADRTHALVARCLAVVERTLGRTDLHERPRSRMLSVVMPGHGIDPHTDPQAPGWLCRIHVPLTSAAGAVFVVGGIEHQLDVGTAYAVNVLAEHSVRNAGPTPRIHFMFDVEEG